jgi:two-component system, OmpR family, phosphate regulon sensor histidine kinase PhoR
MKKNRKIGIILLLIVFLPGLFFSVYEIGSLSRNEAIIEEIYNNQLEVILSSVNQYSEDICSSWAISMNNMFAYPQQNLNTSLQQFLQNNSSIQSVFYITDTSYNDIEMISRDVYSTGFLQYRYEIRNILRKNLKKVNKLYLYLAGGYRKIEAFSSTRMPDITYFVFIADNYRGHKMLCGMVIDSHGFINQVLSPKIQAIVEERFIINVINQSKKQIVYTSEPGESGKMSRIKSLWLLPGYNLGIVYKGKTIEQLARDRTIMNFIIILLLDCLILIGTWFVFKSVKTEIQLSQIRADFISNVSHEIRTPLALISVYIETILLGRVKHEKLKEYYQIIYRETGRLTGIVNKILNFSRIEEKKFKYNFTFLNLNDVVTNVLQRFDYHLKNNGFTIDTRFGSALPEISGDYEALSEVLVNLIDNAIKYSPDEKYLGVKTGIDEDKVYVEITDKGIGIPDAQKQYVFEKFFRVTDGEVQNVGGSGLGLAIVKHIMESHKGVITLTSNPGKGTTFTCFFNVINEKGNHNINL